jgi:HNH endonuclease
LIRDGYQCKVAHVFERTLEEDNPQLYNAIIVKDPDAKFRRTEAAHIIPLCFNNLTDEDSSLARARAWGILDYFAGGSKVVDFLQGQNINNLDNILTLHHEIHAEFDELRCWLEPKEVNSKLISDY